MPVKWYGVFFRLHISTTYQHLAYQQSHISTCISAIPYQHHLIQSLSFFSSVQVKVQAWQVQQQVQRQQVKVQRQQDKVQVQG